MSDFSKSGVDGPKGRDFKKEYNSYLIILQLLVDRKYKTTAKPIPYEQFIEKYINNPKANSWCRVLYFDDKGKKGGVLWPVPPKLGVGELTYYSQISLNNEWSSAILVCKDEPTTQAKKEINENLYELYGIEYFTLGRLQWNPTQHRLVPKHIRLSKKEKEQVLQEYRVDVSNFPIIHTDDPIAKYYNYRKGDLIKVIRTIKKQQRDIFQISYRHVVKS